MNLLISINLVTMVAIIGFGYRFLRFVNRMEFKVDLMWEDYEERRGPVSRKRSVEVA